MLLLALSLQALLFTHMVFLLRHGISLKGDVLEILLLVATIIVTGWVIAKISFQRSPGWLRGIYILNCFGVIPLGLTVVLMGLCMYATITFGTFEAPSGTLITLKEHAGLLGCSVRPYIVQGMFEHLIYRKDNDIFCFTPSGSKTVGAVRWSPNETQLILTLDQEDYTFELVPLPVSSSSQLQT